MVQSVVLPFDKQLHDFYSDALFITPNDNNYPYNIRYDMGPVEISDISQGLNHLWKCYIDNDNVIVNRTDRDTTQIIFNKPNITSIDFTFNQNGQLVFCYTVKNTKMYVYYYDTVTKQFKHEHIVDTAIARITLDTKEQVNSSVSDVMLFTILNNNLVYYLQRERYKTQYTLLTNDWLKNKYIRKIGLNTENRLQFQVELE